MIGDLQVMSLCSFETEELIVASSKQVNKNKHFCFLPILALT
jgi:hypothetical protein